MDNADLETLKLVPGRINPKFNPNVTEYTVMLSSAAVKVTVDCMTSDSGASYQIVGTGGERVVPLKEGLNPIVIEVSAPDGNIKTYTINVTRLAANLAELANLTLSPGKLDRPYQKKLSEYYATLGWAVNEVKLKPVKQDPKMTINIDGNPPDAPVKLVAMETTVKINVVSPDQSNTKVYTVHLLKEDTGYRPSPTINVPDLICGICSSVCQSPRKLVQCGHVFCAVCLSVIQRTDKSCPGCGQKAPESPPFEEVDTVSRDKCVEVNVKCFYCGTAVRNGDLLVHAGECDKRLVTCDTCSMDLAQVELEGHLADGCTGSCKACGQKYPKQYTKHHDTLCLQGSLEVELKHSIKLSNWEKKLRVENSDNFDELFESALKNEAAYHKVKNTADLTVLKTHLLSAATALANGIAASPKAAKAHHRLGLIMEELHYLENCVHGKPVEDKLISQAANTAAVESSKLEEVDAICQIHGVPPTAPLGDKLRAIDQEFHALKEKGDSFRADRVQELYAWKSKQATQAEKTSLNAASDETYLGKASSKYKDAVSLEPTSYQYNYNLGLCFLDQMKFVEASCRFRVCAGAKPLFKHARYLLGISEANIETQKSEALSYLKEGTKAYQHWISCLKRDGETPTNNMIGEAGFRLHNVHFLQGWLLLAHLIENKTEKMDLLLTLTYLIPRILLTIPHRGETYLNTEVVLFTALDKLLSIVETDQKPIYCNRLSMLIAKSSDSGNQKLLELQVETCRKQVFVQSNNARALTVLGDSLLALFDLVGDKALLKEAEVCYRVALKVEGLPVKSKSVPEEIQKLGWFKEFSAPKSKSPPPKAAVSLKRGSGTPARGAVRGTAPKRGAPASRGTPVSRGTPSSRGTPASRGAARGRGAPRGGATASTRKCEPAPKSEEKTEEKKSAPIVEADEVVSGPTNHASTQPRLGLARTLGLCGGDKGEQKELYNEVIKMDNLLHDAYIELGELCRGTLEAVDVYDKFPFSAEPSFDDAFIYGEMVQILMKKKEFDDSRLEKALIGYGKVMGWNSLDSYVKKLEDAYKTKILKKVYCDVNKKSEDDTDVQQYFKVKLW